MEPFVGQIQTVAFNYAPSGWALCNGQLLSISSNSSLFSLLGTIYGGDGRTTFALPDLRGRIALHSGQGPGLSNIQIGQIGGTESVTLSVNELPAHTHSATLSVGAEGKGSGATNTAAGNYLGDAVDTMYRTLPGSGDINGLEVDPTGTGRSFYSRNPFLGIHYVIALQGVMPPRS